MKREIDTPDFLYLLSGNGQNLIKMEIISISLKVFNALAERMKTIEAEAETLCRREDDLRLKKWLDHQEVCQILGISKRALQTYREKGLLPYSQIRHKIFYKPEDVEKLLETSHHPIIPTP